MYKDLKNSPYLYCRLSTDQGVTLYLLTFDIYFYLFSLVLCPHFSVYSSFENCDLCNNVESF